MYSRRFFTAEKAGDQLLSVAVGIAFPRLVDAVYQIPLASQIAFGIAGFCATLGVLLKRKAQAAEPKIREGFWEQTFLVDEPRMGGASRVRHHAICTPVSASEAVLTLKSTDGNPVSGGWDCRVRDTDNQDWFYLKRSVDGSHTASSVAVRFPTDFDGIKKMKPALYEVEFIRRFFHPYSRKPAGWETLATGSLPVWADRP